MTEEKEKILKIWKKAVENYEKKEKKLCEKHKVKSKPFEADEHYTIFEFNNGVQFTVPCDENYDDYDLTGDALKFAEQHNKNVQDCYYEVDKKMEEEGFIGMDMEEWYKTWEKDGKEYEVNHYAKKDGDVTITKK